jgi:hypothetical protein
MISALERHRKDHSHEEAYQKDAESQKGLRTDPRITSFKKLVQRNEVGRRQKATIEKATGTSLGMFTVSAEA